MLIVTFHGGSGNSSINNIYGYDETNPANPPIKDLLEIPPSQLSELRGMTVANGSLYVVNGGKGVSNVLCCSPDPKNAYHYTQTAVFINNSLAAINHPFACVPGPVVVNPPPAPLTQIWYVSNQDTNVVAVLVSGPPYNSATGSVTSSYLTALLSALQNAKSKIAAPGFLDATFVPTAIVGAEIPPQTPVDSQWGGLTPIFNPPLTDSDADVDALKKKKKSKVQNSVRDVLFYGGVLYVADEGGSAVRMFDPELGVPWGSTSLAKGPVHLLGQNGTLYVTSGNSIFSGACVSPPPNAPAVPSSNQFSSGSAPPPYPAPPSGYTNSVDLKLTDLGLNLPSGPSGLAFDGSGNLYVALRTANQIWKYVPNSKGTPPFIPSPDAPLFSVPDNPEFLLWIENQS